MAARVTPAAMGGLIHNLCLPRQLMCRLLVECVNRTGYDREYELVRKLFGKSNYSFLTDRYIDTCSSYFEFGRLKMSPKKRCEIFEKLPEWMREMISEEFLDFGPYFDSQGRAYKWENESLWTVLIPKQLKNIPFPSTGEEVLLHKNDQSPISYIVTSIGEPKKSTCKIILQKTLS